MKLNDICIAVALGALSVAAFAQEPDRPRLSLEERIAKAGGEVLKPGTFAGKVSIVNQQKKVPDSDCTAVAALFAEATRCNVVADDGADAAVKLYVVDDPKEPVVLLAPEDRWGKLNVAKMVDDLPGERAKERFFAPRARKMMLKSLSLLIGGGSSQFPGNVMNAATMRDLDQCQESIPVDMTDNYIAYLKAIGVTQAEKTTYRKACREGWAPAPTNDVQKAIWDKVHAVPATPMKIEFDPKKGR